jgi:hypothetical protein
MRAEVPLGMWEIWMFPNELLLVLFLTKVLAEQAQGFSAPVTKRSPCFAHSTASEPGEST